MKKTILAGIVLIVIIAIGITSFTLGDSDVGPSGQIINIQPGQVDESGNYFKGAEDAPVTIIEYSDFECPYCVRFYEQTMPSIEKNYIETGKVKFIYKHFPLSFHKQAIPAAGAAECAGEQGKYWEMYDKLFSDGVSGGTNSFKDYAKELGLNTEQFSACLDSGKYKDKISDQTTEGSSVGVSGTPAFTVNGKLIVGAQPYNVFEQAIENALKQ